MCTQCSIGELQAVRPELTDLYELEHLQGQAQRQVVMQVAAADEAARGKNIVGLAHDVAVRTPDYLITGILRSKRTYDVARVTFLCLTPSSLSCGALDAEQRAANAATRADATARRVEESADRFDNAVQQLESASNTAEC